MAQAIAALKKGDRFEGMLLVKQSEVRASQNGSRYLDMTVCDRTGEMNAKVWDWGAQPAPEASGVVRVRALVTEYNGKLQMKVEQVEGVEPSGADLVSLVPCAPGVPDDMLGEIYAAISEMRDDDIQLLCAAIVDENREKLRYWPAAVSYHHSVRGGLVYHTSTMLRAARAMLPVYPFLDSDLLIAGVIIHDICKIRELNAGSLGLASEYTRSGQLLGHITMGAAYVLEAARRLGVSEETGLLLSHMVLSHHSEPDFGSPRRPMFPEAELLHYLDTIDARMYDMRHYLDETQPGEFTPFIRSLENRRLYRHAKFPAGSEDDR